MAIRTPLPPMNEGEFKTVGLGKKIAAIKMYRARTGHGLADAKDVVESGQWNKHGEHLDRRVRGEYDSWVEHYAKYVDLLASDTSLTPDEVVERADALATARIARHKEVRDRHRTAATLAGQGW